MSRLIARRQREYLKQLEAVQPQRPILTQPGKEATWVPVEELPPGEEVWTRSVLVNELLFDLDAPWRRVVRAADRLTSTLDELGVPHEDFLSGGKGAHLSIFFDPTGITIDGDLFRRAKRTRTCAWSVARLTLAHALMDAAEFPEGDDPRWAPPIGKSGVFDRLKVKWSTFKRGSMVRMAGTPGGRGFRKTRLPEDWTWEETSKEPPSVPLRWPEEVKLWTVPVPLRQRIVDDLEAAVRRAESAQASNNRRTAPGSALQAVRKLKRIPCVSSILDAPAPKGTRHYAFLNLVTTCRALGLPRRSAERHLLRALRKCGLDKTDKAWELLDEVYSVHNYRADRLMCPSPHVSSFCDLNRCSISRRKCFK